MRILQLGRFWQQRGGVQMHAKLLCDGLAEHGVDVTNLVASPNLERSDQRINGWRLVQAACWGTYFSTAASPDMIRQARKLHHEQPFDLLHLHFPDPMSHLVSLALPKSLPRVITWHSDIVKQKRLLALYRPFQRTEIQRAKAIIAPTAAHFASSTQIPLEYPIERRHIIAFGMNYDSLALTADTEALAKQLRARAGQKLLVFALGRHVTYKGFEVLLNALPHTQANLMLGGEGPLTEALKRQAQELGIQDRVEFLGQIPDSDLGAYYHACDVFCLPSVSTNEAFGLVQLEAMACGKPVICTQLYNGVNVVNPDGVTGITVPTHDPQALASAINALDLDVARRETLGSQARAHALGQYSMKAMSQAHVKLYEQILAKQS